MKVVETEAIILKNYSLAEADKIVLCLTREAGLIRLAVRGAKRLRSRFCGRLEPFTVAEIVYRQKEETELGSLFQAEVVSSYFHLAGRLSVLKALSYLTEILIVLTPPAEPNETLFRMVRVCLTAIDAQSDERQTVRAIASYFEIWLLRLAGFLPDFQTCQGCRIKVTGAPTPFYYYPEDARLLCAGCAGQNRRGEPLSPQLLKVLQAALILPPLKFAQTVHRLDLNFASLDYITHRLLRRILEYDPLYWSTNFETDEITWQTKKIA